jgi:hypothetical protein
LNHLTVPVAMWDILLTWVNGVQPRLPGGD